MPLLSLPATSSSAEIFARAGLAIGQRMASVEAVVAGVPVVGWEVNGYRNGDLDGLPTRGKRRRFACMVADLPAGVQERTAVTLDGSSYLVASRTDDTDLGHATLDLEFA